MRDFTPLHSTELGCISSGLPFAPQKNILSFTSDARQIWSLLPQLLRWSSFKNSIQNPNAASRNKGDANVRPRTGKPETFDRRIAVRSSQKASKTSKQHRACEASSQSRREYQTSTFAKASNENRSDESVTDNCQKFSTRTVAYISRNICCVIYATTQDCFHSLIAGINRSEQLKQVAHLNYITFEHHKWSRPIQYVKAKLSAESRMSKKSIRCCDTDAWQSLL